MLGELWLLPVIGQIPLQGLFRWLCHQATHLDTLGKYSANSDSAIVGQTVLHDKALMALPLCIMHTADGVIAVAHHKHQTKRKRGEKATPFSVKGKPNITLGCPGKTKMCVVEFAHDVPAVPCSDCQSQNVQRPAVCSAIRT